MLSGLERTLTEWVPEEIEPLVSADRVAQFIATGSAGVAVEFVALVALVELAISGELLAAVAGKEVAVLVMFALNERWTFADSGPPDHRSLLRRFVSSHLMRAIGNGVALAVYAILLLWFGTWYLASWLVGIAVGFVFNYLCEGLVTWRPHVDGG